PTNFAPRTLVPRRRGFERLPAGEAVRERRARSGHPATFRARKTMGRHGPPGRQRRQGIWKSPPVRWTRWRRLPVLLRGVRRVVLFAPFISLTLASLASWRFFLRWGHP